MSESRLFTFGAIAVALGGLVLAFRFLGTPSHERLVAMDERRVDDLVKITSAVRDRYPSGVPEHLSSDVVVTDPFTKRPYEYRRIDGMHYVVCGVFDTDQTSESEEQTPNGVTAWPLRYWRHGAGRTCFEIDVKDEPAQPRRVTRL